MAVRLFISDWSGTISDDRLPCYEANMLLLDRYGIGRISPDEFFGSQCGNVVEFLKSFGVESGNGDIQKHYAECYAKVTSNGLMPSLYPGVIELFDRIVFSGVKIAILSSHPKYSLIKEAEGYGVASYVDLLRGDSVDKPQDIGCLCTHVHCEPENSIYAGDMVTDIRAAKKAGAKSLAVFEGFHKKEVLDAESPDHIVRSLSGINDDPKMYEKIFG